MILRYCKSAMVLSVALFYTFVVLNNVTDYDSNYQFVRHVLAMDTTFPGNKLMWRAIHSSAIYTLFYIGIIGWECATMLLCWWGGIRMCRSARDGASEFAASRSVAFAGLTLSMMMWVVAFLTVGGEWFAMWQSPIWNGQNAAFRMFTVVGIVMLIVAHEGDAEDRRA